MKQLKYILILTLDVLTLPAKLITCGLALYYYASHFNDTAFPGPFLTTIGLLLLPIAFHFLGKFLDVVLEEARMEAEYDDHGHHKKFGSLKKLSKAERREIEKQKIAADEVIISSTELKSMTHKGPTDPMKEIDKLIGLLPAKNALKEMAARMQFEKENRKKAKPSMHMVFLGPPGTGKTTCARIMAGFLYKNGYIKKNQCVEIDGNFFNGLSPGESSRKASIIIEKSLGGVLFIDEAYSLLGPAGSAGQEVIATIVKYMEDYRDQFVLVLAGYGAEMEALVDANPGLESRVKRFIWFGSYSLDELTEIFVQMAHDSGFKVSRELKEKYMDFMFSIMDEPNFGNARTVRNVLEKCIDRHALNIMENRIPQEHKFSLLGEDFPYIEIPQD